MHVAVNGASPFIRGVVVDSRMSSCIVLLYPGSLLLYSVLFACARHLSIHRLLNHSSFFHSRSSFNIASSCRPVLPIITYSPAIVSLYISFCCCCCCCFLLLVVVVVVVAIRHCYLLIRDFYPTFVNDYLLLLTIAAVVVVDCSSYPLLVLVMSQLW